MNKKKKQIEIKQLQTEVCKWHPALSLSPRYFFFCFFYVSSFASFSVLYFCQYYVLVCEARARCPFFVFIFHQFIDGDCRRMVDYFSNHFCFYYFPFLFIFRFIFCYLSCYSHNSPTILFCLPLVIPEN